jgi:hypothetical protein
MGVALQLLLAGLCLVLAGAARADDWSAWQRAYDPASGRKMGSDPMKNPFSTNS